MQCCPVPRNESETSLFFYHSSFILRITIFIYHILKKKQVPVLAYQKQQHLFHLSFKMDTLQLQCYKSLTLETPSIGG